MATVPGEFSKGFMRELKRNPYMYITYYAQKNDVVKMLRTFERLSKRADFKTRLSYSSWYVAITTIGQYGTVHQLHTFLAYPSRHTLLRGSAINNALGAALQHENLEVFDEILALELPCNLTLLLAECIVEEWPIDWYFEWLERRKLAFEPTFATQALWMLPNVSIYDVFVRYFDIIDTVQGVDHPNFYEKHIELFISVRYTNERLLLCAILRYILEEKPYSLEKVASDRKGGGNLLHHAAEFGNRECIELILEFMDKTTKTERNDDGLTPLEVYSHKVYGAMDDSIVALLTPSPVKGAHE